MATSYQQMIDNYSSARKEQEDFLKRQQQTQAAQLKAQVDRQIADLDTSYQDNARQAYVQKMQAQRDLPQQLAAQGISGGLSESGNIALNTHYGNQLAAHRAQRDAGAANANLQYGTNLASLNQNYLGKIADNKAYYDNLIQQQRAAEIQAKEAERLAQIEAAAKVRAAQVEAEQKLYNETKNRLQSHLDSLNSFGENDNTKFNYLNTLYNNEKLTLDDVKWLLNEIGSSETAFNNYYENLYHNQKPDYMSEAEWNMYLRDRNL